MGFIPPSAFERYEFEKPIVIVAQKAEIEFAAAQIIRHKEKSHEELEQALRELQERQTKIGNMLFEQLVTNLRLAGLYPKDFNDKTDSLTLANGVVFHVRAKG